MPDLLAHSARRGRPAQAYDEHIRNVTTGALHRARAMLRYYTPANQKAPTRKQLLEIIGDASSYHDFGKLDSGFQDTLHHNRYSANHIRHEDAGAVKLAKHGAMEAAGLVSSHHQGLVRYEFLRERPSLAKAPTRKLSLAPFRIDSAVTQEATRLRMSDYERDHESLLGHKRSKDQDELSHCDGLARRLLLSCLVDADHFDTARHYGNESRHEPVSPRWAERLASLDRYVAELRNKNTGAPTDATKLRQEIRDELYEKCRGAETTHRLRSCDAVVGSGKTTAVMAHLLRVAIERRLRHIIVVLPYTNIIRQSVETYRKALCLEGEDPAQIIAEHHHQAEFKDMDLRHLTTLWRAPIIVTTSVQFFETLAASHTGKLRKLHALPGSAVFLDEAHAALPSELWPQCWNWLMEWTNDWNGHLVLGSGSLAEFWCLPEFRSITEGKIDEAPRLAAPEVHPLSDTLRVKSASAQHLRIRFKTRPDAVSGDDLIAWVESSPGPRLVIVNTVQSAAVLAKRMQDSGKQDVLHLSTALAPIRSATVTWRDGLNLKRLRRWKVTLYNALFLPPPRPIPRSTTVAGDGKHAQLISLCAVDNRIGVTVNNQAARIACGWGSHRWVCAKQSQSVLNFISEIRGAKLSCLLGVPTRCLDKFSPSGWIERNTHRLCLAMMASTSLNTSSAGIHCVRPASISATRRAISSSQAFAIASGESSGSPSRLTSRRWASSPRSFSDSCNACASISFRTAPMMTPAMKCAERIW